MIKKCQHLMLIACLPIALINTVMAHTQISSMPFASHIKLFTAEHIAIYGNDASLFKPYNSSMPAPQTKNDPDVVRKRYGILQLSPSSQAYLDYISDPMGGTIELLQVNTGDVIGKFDNIYNGIEAIYFNGSGNMYVYALPNKLCWGRATYKYKLKGTNKLQEISQPIYYINAVAEIKLPKNVSFATLLQEPNIGSSPVALLQENTKVTVIGTKYKPHTADNWLLISTPLGISGWIKSHDDNGQAFIDIVICN